MLDDEAGRRVRRPTTGQEPPDPEMRYPIEAVWRRDVDWPLPTLPRFRRRDL